MPIALAVITAAVTALILLEGRWSCAAPLRDFELPWRLHAHHVQAFVLENLRLYPVSTPPEDQMEELAKQLCKDLHSSSWGFNYNLQTARHAMAFSAVVMHPVLHAPESQQTDWTVPGWFPNFRPAEEAAFSHGLVPWPSPPDGNCNQRQEGRLKVPRQASRVPNGHPCAEGGAVAVPEAASRLGTVSVLVLFRPLHEELSVVQRTQASLIGALRRGPNSVLHVCAPPEEVEKLPVDLTHLARCIAHRTSVKGLAVVPKRASSAEGEAAQAYGFVSPLGGLVEEEFSIRVKTAAQPKIGVIEFVVIALPEGPRS